MTDGETCAQLYRDLCDASIAKDADGIAAVLADGHALVHMTGMRQSKRAYIAAVLDGTLNYYSAEHESIDVRVAFALKPAAVVTSARRAGTTATLEQMEKYLQHQQMVQVNSRYSCDAKGRLGFGCVRLPEGDDEGGYAEVRRAWNERS